MAWSSFLFFLNTYGVLLVYFFVLPYLWFKEKSREEVIHVLFSAATTVIVVLALKEFFDIPRPYLINGDVASAGYLTDGSFPSLHAALAFSIAATVTAHQRRFGVVLLLVAAIVGIGRVVANVHSPVDIIGGAVIGTLIALFFDRLHFSKIKSIWPTKSK